MEKTLLISFLSVALISGTVANGCTAIQAKTEENRKFGSRIPLALDDANGALLSVPQTRNKFVLAEAEKDVLRQLRAEFRHRDLELMMLLPPPRPAFFSGALTEELAADGTLPGPEEYLANYRATVAQVNAVGIASPDLSQIDVAPEDYYFRRDPHWTPRASSHAALALAAEIVGKSALPLPEFDVPYSTVGKLDEILSELCQTEPLNETSMTFHPKREGSLFGDQSARIAYAGTSFSIAEGSRIPDHLEYLSGQVVQDFSIKGGGAEGAIVSALQWLTATDHGVETVVWEVPYLNSLSQDGFLRHVLGYMLREQAMEISEPKGVNPEGFTVIDTWPDDAALLVEVTATDAEVGRIDFAVRTNDGVTRRKVARSRRLADDQRIDQFYFILLESEVAELRELKFATVGKPGAAPITYRVSAIDGEVLAQRRQERLAASTQQPGQQMLAMDPATSEVSAKF